MDGGKNEVTSEIMELLKDWYLHICSIATWIKYMQQVRMRNTLLKYNSYFQGNVHLIKRKSNVITVELSTGV